jgi:hypothetical protein
MSFETDTARHKKDVEQAIILLIAQLKKRAITHDDSKLEPDEKKAFEDVFNNTKLTNAKFGTPEYEERRIQLKKATDSHYKNNRHHPEHFEDGYRGMNLVDIIEMFCDWYCAAKRRDNADLKDNLVSSQKRFGLSDDIVDIFKNTCDILDSNLKR